MIKVLVVDDSIFMCKLIREILSIDKEIKVVGESNNGYDALEKIKDLKPDVICLDVIMPMPDGIWILEEINKQQPTPVIIFSSIVANNAEITTDIFRLGVIDILQKPSKQSDMPLIKQELIEKIKSAAFVDKNKLKQSYKQNILRFENEPRIISSYSIIAIGSSAGGPPALMEVLRSLPGNIPAGIVVAQHMPENFIKSFTEHMRRVSNFETKVAQDGDIITSGRVLVSPAEKTLTVYRLKRGIVVKLERIDSKPRPSIDAMFESVSSACSKSAIGVILSGMGSDGVKGLRFIKESGGKTFSQDEKTC